MEKYLASFLLGAIAHARLNFKHTRKLLPYRSIQNDLDLMDRVICGLCIQHRLPDPTRYFNN